VINGSNRQPILRLSNLVKGVYKFRLTVKDAKGMESYDDAKIFVKEGASLVKLLLVQGPVVQSWVSLTIG
jgi:hypothetical protein